MSCCSCLARISAKAIVVTVSILVLAVAASMTAIGGLAIAHFGAVLTDGLLAAAWISLVLGVLLGIVAVAATFATACRGLHKARKSLCAISVLTLLGCGVFSAATVVAFRTDATIRLAAETGFDDTLDEGVTSFYRGLRDAYVGAYTQCNATSYFTGNVNAACKTQNALPYNNLDVSHCADSGYAGGTDRVGVFCRNGPGLEPFSVDRSLAFADGNSADLTSVLTLLQQGSFGNVLNAVCMPTSDRYYELMAELLQLNIPNLLLPPSAHANPNGASVFSQCYSASWWTELVGDLSPPLRAAVNAQPTIPEGFKAHPDGSSLTSQEKAFFDALQASRALLLGSPYLSPRLSFCFCADQGAGSRLATLFRESVVGYLQYICLGLATFFALALLAELYLGCCDKPHIKEEPVMMRGWQAGGSSGSQHLASQKYARDPGFLSRP